MRAGTKVGSIGNVEVEAEGPEPDKGGTEGPEERSDEGADLDLSALYLSTADWVISP